jgi:hypothetical protein
MSGVGPVTVMLPVLLLQAVLLTTDAVGAVHCDTPAYAENNSKADKKNLKKVLCRQGFFILISFGKFKDADYSLKKRGNIQDMKRGF